MDAFYKVFISSTYLDNASRRKLVEDAVIIAGMQPVGMERFTASIHPTADECVRLCREADVLVGVIARRYGWIPDGYDRSITEIEYDAATERLMFLLEDSVAVVAADEEGGPERDDRMARLQQFKTRITRDQMPARFDDRTLQLRVFLALDRWRSNREHRSAPAARQAGDVLGYSGPNALRRSYRRELEGQARFYAEAFVDRDEILNEIADFSARKRGGYLIVAGEAGLGKSALIFEFLRRHRDGRWNGRPLPDVVCFFAGGETGRGGSEAFFTAINSQLLDLLGMGGGVPPAATAQRDQFDQLWCRAASLANAHRPLLLLVDGFDEHHPDAAPLPALLPAALGEYVHVVCTSRPPAQFASSTPTGHVLREATIRRLTELQAHDVETLLRLNGITESRLATLTVDIFRLTNGVPLYVRFICADVAAGRELERLRNRPPAGVQEYFARELDQFFSRQDGSNRVPDALGLLLVAYGPMSLDEIAPVLGCPLWQLRKAVEPIRRFLIGDERLRLMHDELARALEKWFGPADRLELRKRLEQWCSSFAERGWPDDTAEYVLRHYADHLWNAGEFEELDRQIGSRWVRVARRALGSHAPVLHGIGLALEAAKAHHPRFLDREVRCNLAMAVVASMSGYVPARAVWALAMAGRDSEAWSHAELTIDAYERQESFKGIAAALAARQQQGHARLALDAALSATEALSEYTVLFDIMKDLSLALAGLGDLAGLHRALGVAQKRQSERHRIEALCGVAIGFASIRGGSAQALSIAGDVLAAAAGDAGPADRAHRLACVLEVAVTARDESFVQELRSAIDSWSGACKLDVLASYAAAAGKLQRLDEARRYAQQAVRAAEAEGGAESQSQAFGRCAAKLDCVTGLESEAKYAAARALASGWSIVLDVDNESYATVSWHIALESWTRLATAAELESALASLAGWRRDEDALELFAVAFARTHATKRAIAIAMNLDPERHHGVLHNICRTLCEQGQVDDARTAVERMEHSFHRAEPWAGIAFALAKKGMLTEAEEAARQSIAERDRELLWPNDVGALVSIGRALFNIGHEERGRQIATEAVRRMTPVTPYYAEYNGLLPAVDAALGSDDFEDAFELAMALGAHGARMIGQRPSPERQAGVLAIAARAFYKSNDRVTGNETVKRLEVLAESVDRATRWPACDDVTVLLALAEANRDAGDRKRALGVARTAAKLAFALGAGNDPRIPILARAADLLISLGADKLKLEAGRRLLAALEERDPQSYWLQHDCAVAATALDRIGLHDEAKAVARRLLNEAFAHPIAFGERSPGPFARAVSLLGKRAVGRLEKLADRVKELAKPDARTNGLGLLAVTFHEIGRPENALDCLRRSFDAARSSGCLDTFTLLGLGATILAHQEDGQVLWRAYQGLQEMRLALRHTETG